MPVEATSFCCLQQAQAVEMPHSPRWGPVRQDLSMQQRAALDQATKKCLLVRGWWDASLVGVSTAVDMRMNSSVTEPAIRSQPTDFVRLMLDLLLRAGGAVLRRGGGHCQNDRQQARNHP